MEFAVSLVQDLEQELVIIDKRKVLMTQIISRIDSLYKSVQGKNPGEISNIDFSLPNMKPFISPLIVTG